MTSPEDLEIESIFGLSSFVEELTGFGVIFCNCFAQKYFCQFQSTFAAISFIASLW